MHASDPSYITHAQNYKAYKWVGLRAGMAEGITLS